MEQVNLQHWLWFQHFLCKKNLKKLLHAIKDRFLKKINFFKSKEFLPRAMNRDVDSKMRRGEPKDKNKWKISFFILLEKKNSNLISVLSTKVSFKKDDYKNTSTYLRSK